MSSPSIQPKIEVLVTVQCPYCKYEDTTTLKVTPGEEHNFLYCGETEYGGCAKKFIVKTDVQLKAKAFGYVLPGEKK